MTVENEIVVLRRDQNCIPSKKHRQRPKCACIRKFTAGKDMSRCLYKRTSFSVRSTQLLNREIPRLFIQLVPDPPVPKPDHCPLKGGFLTKRETNPTKSPRPIRSTWNFNQKTCPPTPPTICSLPAYQL